MNRTTQQSPYKLSRTARVIFWTILGIIGFFTEIFTDFSEYFLVLPILFPILLILLGYMGRHKPFFKAKMYAYAFAIVAVGIGIVVGLIVENYCW